MGENEQGGMLRTVVVVGIVALIAAVIIGGVVGLKASLTKNTDSAVGAVVTTPIPSGASDNQVYLALGNHKDYFPRIGSIPNNSWREVHIQIRSDKRIWFKIDVNDSGSTELRKDGWIVNDNDVTDSRTMKLYKEGDTVPSASAYGDLYEPVYIEPDTNYTIVVKYLNKSGYTFVEPAGTPTSTYYSVLYTGTDDKSQYKLNIKSFEAATYDDKYNK